MKTYENMHVLLLKGGDGTERDVSLNTAAECAKAIKQIGYKITEVDIADIEITSLTKMNIDLCFNALHGDLGEDGSIQGLLNLLKIPYTHSGVKSSMIAMNKVISKKIFKINKILTPPHLVLNKNILNSFIKLKRMLSKNKIDPIIPI